MDLWHVYGRRKGSKHEDLRASPWPSVSDLPQKNDESMEASSGRADRKEPKVKLGSKGRFVRERRMYAFRLNDRKGSKIPGSID
jgi:hypothetical protein